MLNISNAFKQELANDNRAYLVCSDITLQDGTELHLTNENIWSGGFKFEEAVSANNDFQIGAAIIGKHTIIINNIYDDFSDYDFENAQVISYVGLALPDGTTEKIRKGTYFVDEPTYNGSLITLNCLDMMEKFDRPYSESKLEYPASLGRIVRDACSRCDVLLATSTFDNDSYVVQTRPDDESLTFRDIISFAAQISGHWAKMDVYGSLVLGWYKQGIFEKDFVNGGIFDKQDPEVYKTGADVYGGSFNPWDDGDALDGGTFEDQKAYHHIFSHKSFSIGTDDVVITGIQVKDNEQDSVPVLWGDTGYVIAIEDNDLILPGQAGVVAEYLGKRIVGLRFRAFNVSHANDPSIEAGDLAFITDRKSNSYNSFITNTTFSVGQDQQSSCGAQSVSKNSSTRYSQATRGIVEARKMVEKERTEREKAIENLADKLATSSGLYMTPEVQPDGSTIYYMHNKPTKEESDIIWKLTAEVFAISTDGGQTYPVSIDATGVAILERIYTIGLNADYITTGAFKIEKDGRIMVLMDKDTGQVILRPDTFELFSGATIDSIADEKASAAASGALKDANSYTDKSASTTLESANKHSDSAANNALDSANEYTDTTAESTLQSANEHADTAASNAVNDFISKTYNPKIAELQKQLDGQIESFYYDYAPDLSKAPSDAWASDELKARHEGDLFFDKSTGQSYRFFKDGTAWKWQLIQDTGITKALAQAAEAKDTADKKRRTFLTQPTPPYDEGDLWYGGTDKDVLVCKKSREIGAYQADDWGKADRYIDQAAADTAANNAVAGMSQTDVLDKLTNGGIDKGIYLQNGKLYISFSAMRGDELTLGGASNVNGIMRIFGASGNEIGIWDNNGFYTNGKYFAVNKAGSMYSNNPVIVGNLCISATVTNQAYTAQSERTKAKAMSAAFNSSTSSGSDSDTGTYTLNIGDAILDSRYGWVINRISYHGKEENYAHEFFGDVYLQNDLKVGGQKDRVVRTKNYGERLLSAYETPTPMFADIGGGITDENGECIVSVDPVFAETIAQDVEYRVFLQKEGNGDVWIEKKTPVYFIVKGTPNLKFAWELKAVQRDYEFLRTEEIDRGFSLEEERNEIMETKGTYLKEYRELIEQEENNYGKNIEELYGDVSRNGQNLIPV